jgi:hypothetical protein
MVAPAVSDQVETPATPTGRDPQVTQPAEATAGATLRAWQTPTPIPTAESIPVELSIGSLWLKITAPPDNGIATTPTVEVVGRATEGAVLTINEDIILVKEDQVFNSRVELENGPNVIEVLASDINGDELYYFLTVYYEPEQQPGEGR